MVMILVAPRVARFHSLLRVEKFICKSLLIIMGRVCTSEWQMNQGKNQNFTWLDLPIVGWALAQQ